MIEAFLFDIGNVIVDFDFDRASRTLREVCTCPGDPMKTITDLRDQLEVGSIDGEAFADAAIERIGFPGDREEFVLIYQDIFTPNQKIWNLIDRLSGNYPLYLLSNTSDLHHAGLLRDYPVFSVFQGGVFSYAAKATKPGSQIFQAALRELPINASTTLYLDDLSDNVAEGRRQGFSSFCYNSNNHSSCLSYLAERKINFNEGRSDPWLHPRLGME